MGTPAWTRDGRSLIVSSNFDEDWEYEPLESELYRVDVDSGARRAADRAQGPGQRRGRLAGRQAHRMARLRRQRQAVPGLARLRHGSCRRQAARADAGLRLRRRGSRLGRQSRPLLPLRRSRHDEDRLGRRRRRQGRRRRRRFRRHRDGPAVRRRRDVGRRRTRRLHARHASTGRPMSQSSSAAASRAC